MLRRAFSTLFPAFLALALLIGAPGASAAGSEATVASWSAGAAKTSAARGSLTRDIPELAIGQPVDQDDTPDDRVIRVAGIVVWPDDASRAALDLTAAIIGPTHRPCAAPPRGPPIG